MLYSTYQSYIIEVDHQLTYKPNMGGIYITNTVNIRGTEYTIVGENNDLSLLRYDKKYKMWVKVNFRGETEPNSITDTLSEIYIRENA